MTATNGAAAVTAATDAIKEHVVPAVEMLEKNIRQARRAVVQGTHVAEDLAEAAALEVRRRPIQTAAIVAGMAVIAGGVVGFAFGRRARR